MILQRIIDLLSDAECAGLVCEKVKLLLHPTERGLEPIPPMLPLPPGLPIPPGLVSPAPSKQTLELNALLSSGWDLQRAQAWVLKCIEIPYLRQSWKLSRPHLTCRGKMVLQRPMFHFHDCFRECMLRDREKTMPNHQIPNFGVAKDHLQQSLRIHRHNYP